jgi:hypothetical protein
MELDELQQDWDAAGKALDKKSRLADQVIDKVTADRYHASIQKIAYPELAGVVVCLLGGLYVALQFHRLEGPFLQLAGVLTIGLLLAISVLSLLSIRQLKLGGDFNKTYAATLQEFLAKKIRFSKLQKINLFLCHALVVMVIILLAAFYRGALLDNKNYWLYAFPVGYLFLLFVSKRVMKNYNRVLEQSKGLLQEIA